MWREGNQPSVRALLSARHRVSTGRIMAELGVSRETERRDLLDLGAMGELQHVHVGAIRATDEAPIAERMRTS